VCEVESWLVVMMSLVAGFAVGEIGEIDCFWPNYFG